MSRRHCAARAILYSLFSILVLTVAGCNVLGWVAYVAPRPVQQPKYPGLPGQSVGVLVWADRAISIDWPSLPLDAANAIQKKLLTNMDKKTQGERFTMPVQPASILRYIEDHPEVQTMDITEVAPNFGVTRLVYIEVDDFATKAPASLDLYRGSMSGSLKIVEIDGAKSKVVYEEDSIKVVFPPKVPEDGTPKGDNYRFYLGTLDAFSTEIWHRLVPWRPEE